jgi:heme A synthase
MRASPAIARLAVVATILAFVVIVFGAFVRLSDAGLSCPDWPTCYGKATWPGHEQDIARANEAFPQRPVETDKAWREQVHRMLAGTLGALVFALAFGAAWRRRGSPAALFAAALAAAGGVALYIKGAHASSAALSALAMALPLIVAARLDRPAPYRIAVAAFAVIVFQAMLGMWTVTLLLKPVVVMGHLLGGLLTFSLLAYVALSLSSAREATPQQRRLRPMIVVALVLLALQIALGGWTSANYAALACGSDFRSVRARGGRRRTSVKVSSCGAASGSTTKAACSTRRRARRSRSRIASVRSSCSATSSRPRSRRGDAVCARTRRRSRSCSARRSRSASPTSSCCCRCPSRPRTTRARRCCCSR